MKSNIKKKNNVLLKLLLFIIIIIIAYLSIMEIKNYKDKNDSISANSSIDGVEKKEEFKDLYYYNKENEKRYEDYKEKNPDISVDDVVWMVNANIDNEFYTNTNKIEDVDSDLLLVNKYNKLPDNFVPKDLVKLESGYYVTSNTKTAFEKMQDDAREQGYNIGVTSAYRSINSQKYLYNNYLTEDTQEVVDTYSSRPGYSEHHTGEAIDLIGSSASMEEFEKTKESKWVDENAYKYGFVVRYKKGYEKITGYEYEPWHIRYVGVQIATEMKDKNINTLEEYYEKYIKSKK